MRAVVIEAFTTAQGIHPVGQVIQISEALLVHLQGKVRPLEQDGLCQLISDTMAGIDNASRPWDDWLKALTKEQRRSLWGIEGRMADHYYAGDRLGLLEALAEYREFCLQTKNQC